MNEATRKSWDADSDTYFQRCIADYDIIASDPERAFPGDVWEMLRAALPDLRGKRVLAPSSGDNFAAFGFALLGADVTSTDISEKQLENAEKIAQARGWKLKFRQADSMTLDGIPDGAFDLVYTSNGAHVWIGDLAMMYRSFHRVLQPEGQVLFFETHPFHRPFDDAGGKIKVKKPYWQTGPFNDPPEYAWRVQDFLRALLSAGFEIADFCEVFAKPADVGARWHYSSLAACAADGGAKYDWTQNPMAALPSWMAVHAKKK